MKQGQRMTSEVKRVLNILQQEREDNEDLE